MSDPILKIILILSLGITAQWLAWRLGVPSILFLLAAGFIVGPTLDIVHPDQILGKLLFPLVSAAVAILIFEGALNLKYTELRKKGTIVRNLLSVGVLVTWLACALAAHLLLGFGLPLALLLGAILTVTGPTVIAPLLRSLRISPNLATILRWEGIIVDPIGVILAVLTYEAFFVSHQSSVSIWSSMLTLLSMVAIGLVLGFLSAHILLQLFHHEKVPEFLQSPSTLVTLLAMFSISNHIQNESGLLTVTVMGLVMANQKYVAIQKITEFKETLQVLLIAGLFVVLSARIDRGSLNQINSQTITFVLVVLFLVRPMAVLLSCIGTKRLKWREIIFLCATSPRGIVAAALSSLLALELSKLNYPESEQLVTIVFTVIVASCMVTALCTKPLAHLLGLTIGEPRGLIFLGAHHWARELAILLQRHEIPLTLIDTNSYNAYMGRLLNLEVIHTNILAEENLQRLDLSNTKQLLALTSNDEVNSLAAISFQNILGAKNTYQLRVFDSEDKKNGKAHQSHSLGNKQFFAKKLSFAQISSLYTEGWRFYSIAITNDFSYEDLLAQHQDLFYPLMIHRNKKIIFYDNSKPSLPERGDDVIILSHQKPTKNLQADQ